MDILTLLDDLKRLHHQLLDNAHRVPHHSSGDWDYSNTDWELSDVRYVSSPSSFRPKAAAGPLVLIKTATVPITSVKEGRFETYFREDYQAATYRCDPLRVYFRYQDADNYYMIAKSYSTIGPKLVRRQDAADTTLKNYTAYDWTQGAWHRWRITWWNDYVGLVCRVEFYVDDAWVNYGDGYDSLNLWKDEGGRIGFQHTFGGTPAPTFIDDTIISGIS